MPHFGLIDPAMMSEKEAALLRSRLHIRGGRRRLRQGKTAAGLAALNDALVFGMRWYVLKNLESGKLTLKEDEDLKHDAGIRTIINRYEAPGKKLKLNLQQIEQDIDHGIDNNFSTFDSAAFINKLEKIMTTFGVLPFDEKNLPPEDPATY